MSSQRRTEVSGYQKSGFWRKTTLTTVSATVSLPSAVTLGGKVTAESSDIVSSVAREQLQKCRLLRGCHVLFPLQERMLELEEKIEGI